LRSGSTLPAALEAEPPKPIHVVAVPTSLPLPGVSDAPEPDPARTEREIAAALHLRPERPRVTRLSRKVLIGLGAVSAIAVEDEVDGSLGHAVQGGRSLDHPPTILSIGAEAGSGMLQALRRDTSTASTRPDDSSSNDRSTCSLPSPSGKASRSGSW
jgi:type IV secretion system protein VirB10